MKHLTSLLIASSLVSALALAGCRKEEGEKKADDSKTATTQEKKAAKPPPPPVDEGIDVPTEEDFEDQVATQITPESDLNKELDALEKDIGKVDQP
jgi:hypothetical protein